MAGNVEMNGGEGSGLVEVGGCVVNLNEEIGAQPEQYGKEVAAEAAVVEESASSSTDVAISEKRGKRSHRLNRHKLTAVQVMQLCDRSCSCSVYLVLKFQKAS